MDTILLSGALLYDHVRVLQLHCPLYAVFIYKIICVCFSGLFLVLCNRKISAGENLTCEAAEVFCRCSPGHGKRRSLCGAAHLEMQWCLCELGWFLFFPSLFLPPADYTDHVIDNFPGLDALCGSCCLK